MTPETLKALKGSIDKWERIVVHEDGDHGTNNCELCTLFYIHYDDQLSCRGCPASEKYCYGTPYEEWDTYHKSKGNTLPVGIFDKKSYNLALAELNFLKSLLPAEDLTASYKKDIKRPYVNPRTVIADQTPTR